MKRREFLACGAALALGALPGAGAPLSKFNLGIITDEVSDDLEKALEWTQGFGLQWVELRMLWGKYVTESPADDVKRAQDLLAKYGMRVAVLDTAYLKVTLPGSVPASREPGLFQQEVAAYEKQQALLERGIARAKDFRTDKVRIFSFWRASDPQSVFDRVAKELEKAAALARREGVRLVLENEHTCNVATASESAAMLKAVSSPGLGLNWDPGNAFAAGDSRPYPDGYALLDKKRILHLHIKDAQTNPQTGKTVWRPVGGGKIDYVGQFRALLKDGYKGTMSLETHYQHPTKNKELASRESMTGLLEAIRKA